MGILNSGNFAEKGGDVEVQPENVSIHSTILAAPQPQPYKGSASYSDSSLEI